MDGAQFTAARSRITTVTTAAVGQLWSAQQSWRDADADRFVAQAAPLVQAGQTTIADLTSIYIADQATANFDTTVAPPTIAAQLVTGGRGVPPEVVYRRPFVEVYTALTDGRTLAEAVGLGRSRTSEITDLDLQRAYSLAADAAMGGLPERYRPRQWRRVLTGAHSCALCVIASTHRYRRGDLHPLHRACDCRVEPDYGGVAGQAFDDRRLEQVHAAVQALTGRSDRGARNPHYGQLVVDITAEHGELGPLLVYPRDHFDRPGDL